MLFVVRCNKHLIRSIGVDLFDMYFCFFWADGLCTKKNLFENKNKNVLKLKKKKLYLTNWTIDYNSTARETILKSIKNNFCFEIHNFGFKVHTRLYFKNEMFFNQLNTAWKFPPIRWEEIPKFQNVYILLLNTFSFPLRLGWLLLLCVPNCSVWDLFWKIFLSYLLRVSPSTLAYPKKKQPAIENLVVYCDVIWTRIIIENSMIESSDITFLDCMDIVSCSFHVSSSLSRALLRIINYPHIIMSSIEQSIRNDWSIKLTLIEIWINIIISSSRFNVVFLVDLLTFMDIRRFATLGRRFWKFRWAKARKRISEVQLWVI